MFLCFFSRACYRCKFLWESSRCMCSAQVSLRKLYASRARKAKSLGDQQLLHLDHADPRRGPRAQIKTEGPLMGGGFSKQGFGSFCICFVDTFKKGTSSPPPPPKQKEQGLFLRFSRGVLLFSKTTKNLEKNKKQKRTISDPISASMDT